MGIQAGKELRRPNTFVHSFDIIGPPREEKWSFEIGYGQKVISALQCGDRISDAFYNQILSPRTKKLADRHWTPVPIAIRAAQLLTEGRKTRVLDVGSGVGKFCFVGALTTPATFVGVEQSPWLVKEARTIARLLNIQRVRFVQDTFQQINWAEFDAFYFFNPFHENIDHTCTIDPNVRVGEDLFLEYTAQVLDKLRAAKVGTRVVTYHGLGVDLPSSYSLTTQEETGSDSLCLWVKKGDFGENRIRI